MPHPCHFNKNLLTHPRHHHHQTPLCASSVGNDKTFIDFHLAKTFEDFLLAKTSHKLAPGFLLIQLKVFRIFYHGQNTIQKNPHDERVQVSCCSDRRERAVGGFYPLSPACRPLWEKIEPFGIFGKDLFTMIILLLGQGSGERNTLTWTFKWTTYI